MLRDYGKEKGDTEFVNIENINFDWRIKQGELKFIDSVKDEKRLADKQILISRSRLVGLSCLITEKEEGFTFGSYLLRLKPKNEQTPSEYLVNFLNSSIGRLQTYLLQTGSSGSNINPEQIKQIKILMNKDIESLNKKIEDNFNDVKKLDKEIQEINDKSKEAFTKELII